MRGFQPLTRALAVLALAGLAAAPATTVLASAQHPGPAAARATAPSWRVRHLAPEGARLRGSAQVIDPVQQQDFALVPTGVPGQHYRLERFGLGGGQLRRGPVFPGSQLQLAGGFLWVYGAVFSGHDNDFETPVLSEVIPRTLAVVRSWTLAPRRRGGLGTVALAPGPRGTVWVGFERTLLRLSAATGATIRRTQLPTGFFTVGLATDPARRHLYAATEPLRGGGAVFEFLARSGHLLAPSRGRLLRDSVAGADLTAVPGGVFGLFRTGMMGQVVRLSQAGLRSQPLHGAIFGFTMDASMVFGPGALFLADAGGRTGCTSRGGAVRHTTTIRALGDDGQLLAVNRGREAVYGVGRHGLIQISPPASCWP